MTVDSPRTWPVRAEWRADAEPRCFDGHFPGHVVLPGAYVLDGVIERLESVCAVRVVAVRSAKFTAALAPGAVLQLRALIEPTQIRFEALHNEKTAVSGVLKLSAKACA